MSANSLVNQAGEIIALNLREEGLDDKLAEADQFKVDKGFVYKMYDIGDAVVRDPRFAGSNESLERALKLGHNIADTDDGIIMGNFILAKLYLKKGEKEKALKHYNLFFDNNAKAGGNNDHPSVSSVKTAIDSL